MAHQFGSIFDSISHQLIFNCITIISEVRFSRCDWCDAKQIRMCVYENVIVFPSTRIVPRAYTFDTKFCKYRKMCWWMCVCVLEQRLKERKRAAEALLRISMAFSYITTTTDKKALHPKFRNSARANKTSLIQIPSVFHTNRFVCWKMLLWSDSNGSKWKINRFPKGNFSIYLSVQYFSIDPVVIAAAEYTPKDSKWCTCLASCTNVVVKITYEDFFNILTLSRSFFLFHFHISSSKC